MSIKDVDNSMNEYAQEVNECVSDIYNNYFDEYFIQLHNLYFRFKDKKCPITDTELEDILTTLPLELFSAAESLSRLRIRQEVIKMKTKEMERDIIKNSTQTTDTKRKEEAADAVLENKLLITVYESVADRVGREISYSREMIMSAKKIWDSRKKTEDVNPVGLVNPPEEIDNIPAYTQTYVK